MSADFVNIAPKLRERTAEHETQSYMPYIYLFAAVVVVVLLIILFYYVTRKKSEPLPPEVVMPPQQQRTQYVGVPIRIPVEKPVEKPVETPIMEEMEAEVIERKPAEEPPSVGGTPPVEELNEEFDADQL